MTKTIKYKNNRADAVFCLLAILSLLPACGDSLPVDVDLYKIPKPSQSDRAWLPAKAIDLGELGGNYLQFNSTKMSFGDYRFTHNGWGAVLSASFYNGTTQRAYNRLYNGDGSGWAGSGAGYSIVDDGTQSTRSIAATMSSGGVFLSVMNGLMNDGVTTQAQSIGSAANGAGWNFFTADVGGVDPVATHATTTNNGYTTDIAWDATSSAYFGFVDATSLSAQVLRYLGFTGWDAAALVVTTPGNAKQVQVLSEGSGVTLLWRGDEILKATALSVGGWTTAAAAPLTDSDFACTIGVYGDIMCWGANGHGQLGVGNTTDKKQPEDTALTNSSNALGLSVGGAHACAIFDNGAVRCWGNNTSGQMGNNTVTDLKTAGGSNINLSSTATALKVVSGGEHSCAILNDSNRTIKCWGSNLRGQLGHNLAPCMVGANCGDGVGAGDNMGDYSAGSGLPVVGAPLTTATDIAAGALHSCALLSAGTVSCWGEGDEGQLGDNTNTDSSAPVTVTNTAGNLGNVTAVTAGNSHTCALLATGAVACWGANDLGQAGLGVVGAQYDRAQSNNVSTTVGFAVTTGATQISAGYDHTCALINDGTIKCWGDNTYGQVGNGAAAAGGVSTAATVVNLAEKAVQVSAGGYMSCARLLSGAVQCWGRNDLAGGGNIGNPDAASPAIKPYTTVVECAEGEGACALNAARSLSNGISSNFGETRTISATSRFDFTGKAQGFSAATDDIGNLVAVYIEEKNNYATASSSACASAGMRNCANRVYAVVRSPNGVWLDPMQLDTDVPEGNSTYFQSTVEGGINYPTPSVAHLGYSTFITAYPVTETISGSLAKTHIRVRTYKAGVGWDGAATGLGSFLVPGPPYYRAVNEVKISGDGAGNAVVMAQVVDTTTAYPGAHLRKYGYVAYVFSSKTGKWTEGQWISGVPTCPVTQANCLSPRMDGAIFQGEQGVFVFPAPEAEGSTNVRLYSTEYAR